MYYLFNSVRPLCLAFLSFKVFFLCIVLLISYIGKVYIFIDFCRLVGRPIIAVLNNQTFLLMVRNPITIQEGNFVAGQLLHIIDVNGTYTINKVTEKAICIETSDGKWSGDGFVPLWLPISQLTLCGVNSDANFSQNGIHRVRLPEWLIYANSKKW